MKLGWSGFRSAFAFAIIAVTSAAEANSFGGGGGFWAVSCSAIAAVISRVRIVQRTRRRIKPPVRRRLYSIRISPARAQRCRCCATDVEQSQRVDDPAVEGVDPQYGVTRDLTEVWRAQPTDKQRVRLKVLKDI